MTAATFSVVQEEAANALALNKDNSQVVIAGRKVFKIFSIGEEDFEEVCNLRVGKNLNLNFSCNDVAWNTIEDHILATAATNGAVVVWNLNKVGRSKQEHVFNDHTRTVNKVGFHPTEPALLLSGSQDGTMKCFDLRLREVIKTFSNTEGVRDVQFNPHNFHLFSAVSDNGTVQLWDSRRPDRCIQQFTAHSGPIFACDWHPEANWLATASRDKTIKVWDLDGKPKLEYTIHTIASIGHVKWRPQRRYHIASCALVLDSSINIWDVRRPYIPFAAFNEHKDVATGVVWRGDPKIFLSTCKDCTLYQHSFKDATRPESKAKSQSITLNSKLDVLFASKVSVQAPQSKIAGLIRKSSVSSDQFHKAASSLHYFASSLAQDFNWFVKCAEKYMICGKSLSEMCDHNAAVAKEHGKMHISVIWSIIKTLYASDKDRQNLLGGNLVREDALQNSSYSFYNADDKRAMNGDLNGVSDDDMEADSDKTVYNGFLQFPHFNKNFQLPRGDFCFGENELDIELDRMSFDLRGSLYKSNQSIEQTQQQDWTLPNEAFTLRHEIKDSSPPPEQYPNHESFDVDDSGQNLTAEDHSGGLLLTVAGLAKMRPWDPSEVVVDALKYYVLKGDVQTSTSILLVLGERRANLTSLDENTQEHWLASYIDLLAKHRLWNVANKVIKLSWIPSISQMNQQSTTYYTNCDRCSKPLQRSGWICDKCHSSESALCSVCHQVVKGLYVWCQGCSHGGHLAHIKQWMAKNAVCPTGCGHRCEYS